MHVHDKFNCHCLMFFCPSALYCTVICFISVYGIYLLYLICTNTDNNNINFCIFMLYRPTILYVHELMVQFQIKRHAIAINKQAMQTKTAGWHSLVWNYGFHKLWQSSIFISVQFGHQRALVAVECVLHCCMSLNRFNR